MLQYRQISILCCNMDKFSRVLIYLILIIFLLHICFLHFPLPYIPFQPFKMVNTRRSSRPGQSTFASLPTLYRKRQSSGQPKSQPASSSTTPAGKSELVANPESREEATNQISPLSPAKSSNIDNQDQAGSSYEVAGKSAQFAISA